MHPTHRISFGSSAVLVLIHCRKLLLVDFFFLAFLGPVGKVMADRRSQTLGKRIRLNALLQQLTAKAVDNCSKTLYLRCF